MENNKASDALTAEEARSSRLLIKEDIAKYELAKARAIAQLSQYDAMIAECHLALADIDRREAGVDYPEPVAKKADEGSGLGEITGGSEEKGE